MLAFLLAEDAADIHPRGQVRLHLLILFPRTFSDISRTSQGYPLYCSSRSTCIFSFWELPLVFVEVTWESGLDVQKKSSWMPIFLWFFSDLVDRPAIAKFPRPDPNSDCHLCQSLEENVWLDYLWCHHARQRTQTNQRLLIGKQLFRHCLCRWHSCQFEQQIRIIMSQMKLAWISEENFNQPLPLIKKQHFQKNVSSM